MLYHAPVLCSASLPNYPVSLHHQVLHGATQPRFQQTDSSAFCLQIRAMCIAIATSCSCLVCMQAFKALQGLIMSVLLTAVDDKHANPVWPGMGYPGQMRLHPPHLILLAWQDFLLALASYFCCFLSHNVTTCAFSTAPCHVSNVGTDQVASHSNYTFTHANAQRIIGRWQHSQIGSLHM